MIKNIIFDMDGVLLDSENGIRTACMEMFKRHGINTAAEDFLPFTGMGENRFIGGVAEKYGLNYDLSMKAEAYSIYGEIASEYVILFDNIRELMLKLKETGYNIAVASAADEIKVKINLKCMGLSTDDFGTVVTGNDVPKLKPDPMIFLEAARRIGANPRETLVVEDAVSGCKAAKAAGMTCIGVMSTFDEETLKAAGADFVVARTYDMLEVLKENNGMHNIHGHCVCGAVEIIIKEYGNFIYTCHCDTCRRMNSGPVLSVDPGPKENVVFERGEEKITVYHDEEVERGFCSVCGSTLFWHNPADNHYCMNAELFDDIIQNGSFNLELFYDMKPAYYSFAGERKKLNRNFQEI